MFPSFIRWTRNAKISYWLIIKKSSQKCESFYFLKYIIAVCINLSLSLELNVSISEFVLTKVNGKKQTIEVTIPTKHFTLRNEETNEDLYAAIDKIVDKLERQIRKNKEKINKKVNKTLINDFEYDLVDELSEEEKVVKRKNVELKPIDEEEAIIQMEMLGHSFFVYKDVSTNEVCVLYKRKNGNYGIIETK